MDRRRETPHAARCRDYYATSTKRSAHPLFCSSSWCSIWRDQLPPSDTLRNGDTNRVQLDRRRIMLQRSRGMVATKRVGCARPPSEVHANSVTFFMTAHLLSWTSGSGKQCESCRSRQLNICCSPLSGPGPPPSTPRQSALSPSTVCLQLAASQVEASHLCSAAPSASFGCLCGDGGARRCPRAGRPDPHVLVVASLCGALRGSNRAGRLGCPSIAGVLVGFLSGSPSVQQLPELEAS